MLNDTAYQVENQSPGRSTPINYAAIHVGISRAFHNKEFKAGFSTPAFGNSFIPTETTLEKLFEHINNGNAWTPGYFAGISRTNQTWRRSELIVLDLDNNVSVADCLAVPFIRQYAAIIHPSASSSAACYKTRVIFRLSETVDGDFHRWRALAAGIMRHVGLDVDPASIKPAQLYYGSTNQIEQPYVNLKAVLPIDYAGALTIDDATEDMLSQFARQDAKFTPIDPDSDLARRIMAKTMETIFHKLATEGGSRWGNCYKYSAFLFGLMKGGAPVTYSEIEAGALDACRGSGALEKYGENELKRCIRDAHKAAEPKPLELPEKSIIRRERIETAVDWQTLPDAILSSILRCYPRVAPLFYIIATAGFDTFTDDQIKAVAIARGWSESTFNHTYPLLFLPPLQLLECIGEGNIHSKSCKNRVIALHLVKAQLHEMEAKRLNVEYNPTGAPPKSGDEDTRIVALQTAEMMRDSGIDENPDAIAVELNQKLEPVFEAQGHTERKARAAAGRKFRRICDSYDDPHQTAIPADSRIHTVPDFRAAYANAYASEHEGALISRKEWKDLLGCSDAGLKDILARAGVKGETPDELPSLEIRAPQDIERIIPHGRTVKGFPLKVVYTTPDGQEITRGIDARANPEGMHRICEMALESGTAVKVVYQTAKEYHVERAPLPTKERVITEVGQGETFKKIDFVPQPEQPESEPTDPRKYPRRWLVGQYQLALERMGWKRDSFGVYDSDGEYAPDNPRALIELILGRSLSPIGDIDPDFYQRPPTEYELNARHDYRMEMISQGYRLVRLNHENESG